MLGAQKTAKGSVWQASACRFRWCDRRCFMRKLRNNLEDTTLVTKGYALFMPWKDRPSLRLKRPALVWEVLSENSPCPWLSHGWEGPFPPVSEERCPSFSSREFHCLRLRNHSGEVNMMECWAKKSGAASFPEVSMGIGATSWTRAGIAARLIGAEQSVRRSCL